MDLQTLLPRSTEVARARHVEIQRPALAQQQFAAEISRAEVRKQRTVSETPRVRGGRVDPEAQRGGKHESGAGSASDGGRESDGSDGLGSRGPQGDTTGGSPQGGGRGRLVNVILDLGSGQGES